jgi:ribosome-associated protein
MKELIFLLESDQEYIQLNNLLKVLHLVGTGGEAHIRIDNGEVILNNTTETQRRKKIRRGDVVLFQIYKIKVQ